MNKSFIILAFLLALNARAATWYVDPDPGKPRP